MRPFHQQQGVYTVISAVGLQERRLPAHHTCFRCGRLELLAAQLLKLYDSVCSVQRRRQIAGRTLQRIQVKEGTVPLINRATPHTARHPQTGARPDVAVALTHNR